MKRVSTVGWLAIVLIVLLGQVWPARAAFSLQVDQAQIDAFIRKEMDAARIPGLSLVITRNGEIVLLKAYGSDGRGAPLTPQTPMYLGSLSKSFTALSVMQLVEDGKIDLDAPVQTYIPGFVDAQPGHADRITIRNLLNQTSGLTSTTFDESAVPALTLAERVESLSDAQPNAAPGEKFQYFNPNYSVLGLVIEQASGMPYGDYIREYIFDPLQMNHSTAYATQVHNLAQGYTIFLGFPQKLAQPYQLSEAPAGFLVSTAEDLGHYLIALADAGIYDGVSVISPTSIETMQNPPAGVDSPYGMGWFREEQDGQTVIYHTGDLPAFHAFAAFLPESNVQIAFLINQNGLVPSSVTFPRLRYGLINLLSGQQPGGGITSNTIYFILTLVIAFSLVTDVRRFILVPMWAKAVRQMSRPRVIFDIAWEFLVPILLLILLPLVMRGITGRSFNWNLAYLFLPDVVIWLLIGMALNLARGFRKILAYRSEVSMETESDLTANSE